MLIPLIILLTLGAAVVLLRWNLLYTRRDLLRGKVVIITGASRGIGREIARELAKRGASLVLAARTTDQLDDVCAECRDLTPNLQTLVVPADLTDDAQRQNLITATLEKFGRIDALINNAGIMQGGVVWEIDPDSFRQQVEINVIATMRLTQLALPHLIAQRSGWIVTISSAGGRHGFPYFAAYSATKHAQIGFSDALRRELFGTGVRVMVVTPGFVDTDFNSVVQTAWRKMGLRLISPERVARGTVEGMLLGVREVKVGLIEGISGVINQTIPWVIDLYWRVFAPKELREVAKEQRTS